MEDGPTHVEACMSIGLVELMREAEDCGDRVEWPYYWIVNQGEREIYDTRTGMIAERVDDSFGDTYDRISNRTALLNEMFNRCSEDWSEPVEGQI